MTSTYTVQRFIGSGKWADVFESDDELTADRYRWECQRAEPAAKFRVYKTRRRVL